MKKHFLILVTFYFTSIFSSPLLVQRALGKNLDQIVISQVIKRLNHNVVKSDNKLTLKDYYNLGVCASTGAGCAIGFGTGTRNALKEREVLWAPVSIGASTVICGAIGCAVGFLSPVIIISSPVMACIVYKNIKDGKYDSFFENLRK